FQLALLQPRLGIADRLPAAVVPQHHRAAAILALGDRALEIAITDGVILDFDRQSLVVRVEAGPLGDRPALQHPAQAEAEIVMQPGCGMFLHHEEAVAACFDRLGAGGLGGFGEVALLAIAGQRFLRGALPGHQRAARRLAGAFAGAFFAGADFAAGFRAAALRGGVASVSSPPARLRFSASIRLMTLPRGGASSSLGSGLCFSLAATSSFTAAS